MYKSDPTHARTRNAFPPCLASCNSTPYCPHFTAATCAPPSHPVVIYFSFLVDDFSSFLVLKPRKLAWILVAASVAIFCFLRTRKPRTFACILVADLSSTVPDDEVPEPEPAPAPGTIPPDAMTAPLPLPCPRICLRTRYPRNPAWIFVAASSSDWEEFGELGWICILVGGVTRVCPRSVALAAIVVDEAVRLNRFRISRNRFHRCRWVLLGSLDHFFHRVSHNRLALSFLHAYEHTRIQAWFGLSFPAAGWWSYSASQGVCLSTFTLKQEFMHYALSLVFFFRFFQQNVQLSWGMCLHADWMYLSAK